MSTIEPVPEARGASFVQTFVTDLYRNILGREPDPAGLLHHARWLEDGGTPGELVRIFLGSDEHKNRRHANARRLFASDGLLRDEETRNGVSAFPVDYMPSGEAGKSYLLRLRSGFLDRYCSGSLVLDVGFSGYSSDSKTAVPGAIGVDLDYPNYDGRTLPFADGTVDTVISSHCLEHIQFDHYAIHEWYRVLKPGGFIVCFVPNQALYEKRRFLPSSFNEDHKRMYTPATLCRSFEEALKVNSYRVRHLADNDRGFDYDLGPEVHSVGSYEIEFVVEKIITPAWGLA